MHDHRCSLLGRGLILGGLSLVLLTLTPPLATAGDDEEAPIPWKVASAADGARLYRAVCAGCHGRKGDGKGPASDVLFPRPRDLTRAEYRFRSTRSGTLPTREDLLRTIRDGLPGTPMPAWGTYLDKRELASVVVYLETLSERFGSEPRLAEDVLIKPSTGKAPAPSPAGLARGRVLYEKMRCGTCHGADGSGDGVAAPTLKNNDGRAADIFDFSYGVYKGGYDPIAVYRTFVTGLDGTPMPSYAESLPDEADRWALVHYCRSLSRARGFWFYLKERPTWEDPVLGR